MSDAIKQLAEKFRVRTKNTSSEIVAPGKFGEIADNYGDGLLRMRLTAVRRNASMNKALNSRDERAKAAGMELHQRNGYETVWLFRPDNEQHCELAIELIRPKRRRVVNMTDEQRAAVGARLAAHRPNAIPTGAVGD